MNTHHIVIILAAGQGTRFASSIPKQFSEVSGQIMSERSISTFLEFKGQVSKVLLVVGSDHREYISEEKMPGVYKPEVVQVPGGDSRGESILSALTWAMSNIQTSNNTRFIIHDACRPFLTKSLILKFLKSNEDRDGWVTFQKPADALALSDEKGKVFNIPSNLKVLALNTPIMVSARVARAIVSNQVESFPKGLGGYLLDAGYDLAFVESDGSTRKITWPSDV